MGSTFSSLTSGLESIVYVLYSDNDIILRSAHLPVRSGPEFGFRRRSPLLAVHRLAVPAHGELLVEDPLAEVALEVPAQPQHVPWGAE